MAEETKDKKVEGEPEETEATEPKSTEAKPEVIEEAEVVEDSSAEPEAAEEPEAVEATEEPAEEEAPVKGDEPPSQSVPEGTGDGLAAFFQHPGEILDAAEKARDKKFEKWDVFTPFPIHGMDDAMGIGRSWMPWVTFCAAMTGMTTALGIQFGTMYFDWQIVIGGKPFFAWPSFMPITFELSVLFAGLTTTAVMFLASGLPKLKPKIIDKRITRDRFVLWIDAEDPHYDPVKTRAFLEGLDPLEVREVRFDT